MLSRSLRTKFDWLVGAHTEALVSDLDALRARLPIERVCPSFGGTIEGAANVTRLFDATIVALRKLASEPPVSPLAGFNWRRALGPEAVADLTDSARVPRSLRPAGG